MKNKKLFAILTLLCFMFTLMPVAAFAQAVDEQNSYVLTVKDNPTIKDDKTAEIQFKFDGTTKSVYVWFVKDGAKVPANSVAFEAAANGVTVNKNAAAPATANIFNVSKAAGIATSDKVEFKFTEPGEYKVYASIDMPNDTTAAKAIAGVGLPLETIATQNVITVKANAAVTSNYVMVDQNGSVTNADKDAEDSTVIADGDEANLVSVVANGASTQTVKLQLLDAVDGEAVAGADVKISSGSANVTVSKEKATTNALGVFSFDITAAREGEYKVYVSVGQYEMTILVGADTTDATSIVVDTVAKAPTALDTDYTEDNKGLTGKIGFRVYDATGSEVTGKNYTGGMDNAYTAEFPDSTDDAKNFVALTSAPADSDLDDENFRIAWKGDEYGWTIVMNETFDEEGTYEFKVTLDNGAYATASIEVKEFGTPVGIIFTYDADSVEIGGNIAPKAINWIDANNVTKAIDSTVEIAVSGYAVADVDRTAADKPVITVKDDEKYVGSEITITAVDERYNLVASKTLKVANEASELALTAKTTDVNVNNKIVAKIVDKDGNSVTPAGVIASSAVASVVVLDKPEGAKVSATVGSLNAAKGQFDINLTSNKVGNVAIQAVLKYEKIATGATAKSVVKYYTGSQIFAIGTEGKGDVVVMSIGSNEIVINDAKATIDAAPIVENNRTFVPFRALAEAFGAEVAYDEATQAVTAELNGVTVVMTIGSAEYTVNGEAKTADVAPFINGSRTMVPVRFAAEAFGIKVIPTYDENGATADILFNL